MKKTITNNQILGERGVNLVQAVVLKMGCTWHPSNQAVEGGIDGWVELRDPNTGEIANSWIAVQSKAVSEAREDATSIKYTPKQKDVEYWMKGNQPVVLIVSAPDRELCWWVSVKDYYSGKNISTDRMIQFDKKQDLLSAETASQWKSLSEQHGDGAYFTPVRRQESLSSNLIEVKSWGTTIYSRRSSLSDPKKISDKLREVFEWAPREWILSGENRLHSFHDLSESPWGAVCEGETDTIPSNDWAFSEDEGIKRQFVQLLNRCLGQFVRRLRMRFSKDEDCYYFHPDRDGVIRTLKYKSRKKKASRGVVKRYMKKTEPDKLAYYRHDAFRHRFLRFGNDWFLMVEPDYVFTSDGKELDPYREERKSKIKTIEGDAAICGSIAMYRDIFNDPGDLFREAYEFLNFGIIAEIEIPAGIDDAAWSRIKADRTVQTEKESEFGKGLFDE